MATDKIVLSGMRPTGALHLGHYHGAIKNWVRIQSEVESLFFVADWHALTTHYDEVETIEKNAWEMVIDWLAAGIDPEKATIFIQSKVLEHAELTLLMSMFRILSVIRTSLSLCLLRTCSPSPAVVPLLPVE